MTLAAIDVNIDVADVVTAASALLIALGGYLKVRWDIKVNREAQQTRTEVKNAVQELNVSVKETKDEAKSIHMLCNGTHMNALKAAASYARQLVILKKQNKESEDAIAIAEHAATDAERALYEHMVAEEHAKEQAEKVKRSNPDI